MSMEGPALLEEISRAKLAWNGLAHTTRSLERELVLRVVYQDDWNAPIMKAVQTITRAARRVGTVESMGVPGIFFRIREIGVFVGVLLAAAPHDRDDAQGRRRWASFMLTVVAPRTDDEKVRTDVGELTLVEHVARIWCVGNGDRQEAHLQEDEVTAGLASKMPAAGRRWLTLVATGGGLCCYRPWGRVGGGVTKSVGDRRVLHSGNRTWQGACAEESVFSAARHYFELNIVLPGGGSRDFMIGVSPPEVNVDSGRGYTNTCGVHW